MSLIRLWMEIFYFSFIIAVSFPYFVFPFFPLRNLQCNSIEFSIQTIILPIETQHKKNNKKPEQTSKHGRLHDILLIIFLFEALLEQPQKSVQKLLKPNTNADNDLQIIFLFTTYNCV